MAIACPSCGKENRDKARFCRGCARPLDRPGGDAAADEVARERAARALRRARRRKTTAGHAERPAWSRWAGAMLVGVLALAIGWWLGAQQKTPAPALAAPLSAAAVAAPSDSRAGASLAPARTERADDAATPSPTDTAAVDRLRHSVEILEQQDRDRAAAQAQQRQKMALEQKRLEDARRRTDALSAVSAGAPTMAPPAPTAPVASVAVVPATPAVPTKAAPPASVDQQCADSGNVFTRDFCRMRECGKASFANDPVCVRFRQMEEARRRDAEYR